MRMGGADLGCSPYMTNSPNPTRTVSTTSEGAKDQFPAGMRVLVVDDDQMTLVILEAMLRRCSYNVTTCGKATAALAMLRENRHKFDLVISDVYMPDMDGFKLLELVGLEMDLPVIMMSTDGDYSNVFKGITHGACDYLLKPVRMEELRNIWQHVIRKRKNEAKDVETSTPTEVDKQKQHRGGDDVEHTSSANSKKRKDVKEEDDGVDNDSEDPSSLKKPRVVWTVELHQQFVNAVNQLNIDKAVPKKILELMDVPGLTRENVASHLQKYRLYLKRISVQQPQSSMNLSFDGIPEARSHSTFSLQPMTGAVQQGVLGRIGTTNNGIASTTLDQSGLLQLSGVTPPVYRPGIASPVFSTQNTYLPTFTGGYQLDPPPVSSYTGLNPVQQQVVVSPVKQQHHPSMSALGGLPGGFQSGNPMMVQLLQQRQQQQQQQPQYTQGIHHHHHHQQQQQQQQRGISVDEIGFTGLGHGIAAAPVVTSGMLRATVADSLGSVIGDSSSKSVNLMGVVDSNFSPASLVGVPLVSTQFEAEIPVASHGSFNSGIQVQPQQQQQQQNQPQQFRKKIELQSLREEKSTADSGFKAGRVVGNVLDCSLMSSGSRVGGFEIELFGGGAAAGPVHAAGGGSGAGSDDLLSFYLKQQQQEDLGFVENELAAFDGFVADNLYVK